MVTKHTFEMPEAKAALVHKVISNHCGALKNWIASATERNEIDYAQTLVKELRDYERLYAMFNVEARRSTAERLGEKIGDTFITF